MAGGIAHDFNNILSAIFAYSQLAINHISDPERAKIDIRQIQKAGQKASDFTGQIMSFSRRTGYNKIAMPISNVVKEALELFSSTSPETIEIVDSIHSSALIMADPTSIHQLMLNLCTNAFHAMAKTRGVLTVVLTERAITTPPPMFATLQPGNYLELTVSDTGHGMDLQTMERIFEPYFTTKKTGQGTGFGLALVHSIVKDHGGEIFVKSEPDKGTRFHLFFPII
jgi:signal transduction histidine kinase